MQSISIYHRPHQGLEKNCLSNHLQPPPQILRLIDPGRGTPPTTSPPPVVTKLILVTLWGQECSGQALK